MNCYDKPMLDYDEEITALNNKSDIETKFLNYIECIRSSVYCITITY